MTLIERRDNIQKVYRDEDRLSRKEWRELLGITTVGDIIFSYGIEARRSTRGNKSIVATPISEFPKIIAGFSDRRPRKDTIWALGIDTTQNFQVDAPSGATLIYEYPLVVNKLDILRNKVLGSVKKLRRLRIRVAIEIS